MKEFFNTSNTCTHAFPATNQKKLQDSLGKEVEKALLNTGVFSLKTGIREEEKR